MQPYSCFWISNPSLLERLFPLSDLRFPQWATMCFLTGLYHSDWICRTTVRRRCEVHGHCRSHGLAQLDPWTLGWQVPVQRLQLWITLVITQDHIWELPPELLEGHQDWIAFFASFEPHLAVACQNPSIAEATSFGRTGLQGALAIPQHMAGITRAITVETGHKTATCFSPKRCATFFCFQLVIILHVQAKLSGHLFQQQRFNWLRKLKKKWHNQPVAGLMSSQTKNC